MTKKTSRMGERGSLVYREISSDSAPKRAAIKWLFSGRKQDPEGKVGTKDRAWETPRES